MQLTMLKESFFFLPSYKYEHFKRNFFREFAASRTTALAYSGLALHLGSSFDQNGCPKNRKNCFEILDSWLAVNDIYEGRNEKWNVKRKKN